MSKQNLPTEKRWYAIHTYAGYEESVAKNLMQRVESLGLGNLIFNVLVPKEKKIKIVKGEKKVVEEKIYPGYVLVEMIVTDESWYIVRNTPNVTGFVGSGTTPLPLDEDEVKRIMERMQIQEPEYKIDFRVGDMVKIIDGAFKGFEGKVAEIDSKKGKARVMVQMFGRETPVEVDYVQIKKL